jgi:hypothetical protein
MRKYFMFLLVAAATGTLGLRPSSAQEEKPQPEYQAYDPALLEIGRTAPDIEAGDLDQVVFKLSDYRGKVVVLDFWGDW